MTGAKGSLPLFAQGLTRRGRSRSIAPQLPIRRPLQLQHEEVRINLVASRSYRSCSLSRVATPCLRMRSRVSGPLTRDTASESATG